MKKATRRSPIAPASKLRFTESCPSVGSTREDWTTSSDTGSAPELMRSESSLADCVVKLPSMIPRPEVNTVFTRGAEIRIPAGARTRRWRSRRSRGRCVPSASGHAADHAEGDALRVRSRVAPRCDVAAAQRDASQLHHVTVEGLDEWIAWWDAQEASA